jgi:hypothetical protein
MAESIDTLLVRVEADLSDVNRKLDQLEKKLKDTESKGGASLAKLGKVFKVALAAVAVRELAQAGMAAVNFVGDIQEMQAKSDVVFGEFVGGVRSSLGEFADQVGRSAFELEGMAATIQDTFVPMGFARGEAAELSIQMTKLATDVASFNNAADAEVMRAFQSAIVGNHETVRQFGIVMTQATLQQELYAMGIDKNITKATEQEKIQARLNIIMKGTADAHGDAERTQDSFQNQMKRLNSEINNLIYAAVNPLMDDLADLVGFFADAAAAAADFFDTISGAKAARELEKTLSTVAGAQKYLAEAENELTAALEAQGKASGQSKKSANDRVNKARQAVETYKKLVEVLQKAEAAEGKDKGGETVDTAAQEATAAANREVQKEIDKLADSYVVLQAQLDGLSEKEVLAIRFRREHAGATDDFIQALVKATMTTKTLSDIVDEGKEADKRYLDQAMTNLTAIEDLAATVDLLKAETEGMTEAEKRAAIMKASLTMLTEGQKAEIDALMESMVEYENKLKEQAEKEEKDNEAKRVGVSRANAVREALNDLKFENAQLSEKIGGATDAELRRNEIMRELPGITNAQVDAMLDLEAANDRMTKSLDAQEERMGTVKAAAERMGGAIADSIADAVVEGKLNLDNFGDIFKQFVKEIIAEAIRMFIIKTIFKAFGLGGGGDADAGMSKLAGGGTLPRGTGGPVLVGERGPELFIPQSSGVVKNLHDTRNLMKGGGPPVVVNQTLEISTGVAPTVRAEMMNLMPMIKAQTEAAVLNKTRRGGSYGKAFRG